MDLAKYATPTDSDSDLDVDLIAETVTDKLKSTGFHIDAQQHYDQHIELQQWILLVNNARNAFLKGILSLLTVAIVAAMGLGLKHGIK